MNATANTAECVGTTHADSWGGDSYWKVDGAGCKPNAPATKCNTSQLEYLHSNGDSDDVSNGCYKGSLDCRPKYTLLNGSTNRYANATGCGAICNQTTDYLWQMPIAPAPSNPCVPELFMARDYCKGVNTAETKAATFMSIPYFVSIVLSPLLGYGVDMLGKRALLATFASVVLIGVHLTLGITR
jgi:hypothetical protein